MPKTSRGGKMTTIASSIPIPTIVQQVTPPTPQQVLQGNVLPGGGVPFDQFEGMTDDQKAAVIQQALGQSLPVFLDDSGLQKFAYYTGLSNKPQIVTEAQLKAMPGQDIWRSVASTYNRATDIGYSSKDIYNQVATGDFTCYSNSGGSVYGRAIYFDIHKGSYGSGRNYTIMHAKIAPTAKTITYRSLMTAWQRERNSGSSLAKAIMQADHASQANLYAIAKGYDVVIDRGGSEYHMVLNRRALIMSDKTF